MAACSLSPALAQPRLVRLIPGIMDDRPKVTSSLYDYSDKSIRHASIAAIVYGVIAIASILLAWLQAALYRLPAPVVGWIVYGVIIGAISGILAFGIFRRNKAAVVLMLIVVIVPQIYTWFIAHSFTGTIVSFFVAGFLLRGAARIFQKPEENDGVSTPKA
jgi:uncharacterized protein YacL